MSSSSLQLDVGQANELKLAFRRFGWDNEQIKDLCSKDCDVLGQALALLRGDVAVVEVDHIVDLSSHPALDGDTATHVIKHVTYGMKPWAKVRLAVVDPKELHYGAATAAHVHHDDQLLRRCLKMDTLHMGFKIPRFLVGQKLANINMRNFLLSHPHLVPDVLTNSRSPILFWGTILGTKHDRAWVPGIEWYGGKWHSYERIVYHRNDQLGHTGRYDEPCAVFV